MVWYCKTLLGFEKEPFYQNSSFKGPNYNNSRHLPRLQAWLPNGQMRVQPPNFKGTPLPAKESTAGSSPLGLSQWRRKAVVTPLVAQLHLSSFQRNGKRTALQCYSCLSPPSFGLTCSLHTSMHCAKRAAVAPTSGTEVSRDVRRWRTWWKLSKLINTRIQGAATDVAHVS